MLSSTDVGEEHEWIVFSWAKEGTGGEGGRNVTRRWGDALGTRLGLWVSSVLYFLGWLLPKLLSLLPCTQ